MYTFQQNSLYNDPPANSTPDPLFSSHYVPTQSSNLLTDTNAYPHPDQFSHLDPAHVDLSGYGALDVSNDNDFFVANGPHPGYPGYPASAPPASQQGQSSHLGSVDLLNVHSHVPPASLLHQQVDDMHYAYTHVQEPSVTALTHGHMHAPDASRSSSHGLHVPVSPPDAVSVDYSTFFTGCFPERDLSVPSVAPEVGELGSAADFHTVSARGGGLNVQLPSGPTDQHHPLLGGWEGHMSEQNWNESSGAVFPGGGNTVTLPEHLSEVGHTSSDHAAHSYYMQTDWVPQQYSNQPPQLFYTSDTSGSLRSHQHAGFLPSSLSDRSIDQRNTESSLVQSATATSSSSLQVKSITAEVNPNATRSTSANDQVSLSSVSSFTESGNEIRGRSTAAVGLYEFDTTNTNEASTESRLTQHELQDGSASASSSLMESSLERGNQVIEKHTTIGSQAEARDIRMHILRTEGKSGMSPPSGGETSTSADYSWQSDRRNQYIGVAPASSFMRPTAPVPPDLRTERQKRSQTSKVTRRVLHGDSPLPQNTTPSKPTSLPKHSSTLTSAMQNFSVSSSSQAPASPGRGEFAVLPPQQPLHGTSDSGTAHAERLRARQAIAQGNAQVTLANEREVLERVFTAPSSRSLSSQLQRGQQQHHHTSSVRPSIQRSRTENPGLYHPHTHTQGLEEGSQVLPFTGHSLPHSSQPVLGTDLQEARSTSSGERARATSFVGDGQHVRHFTPRMSPIQVPNVTQTRSEMNTEATRHHTPAVISGLERLQTQTQQRNVHIPQHEQQTGLRSALTVRNPMEVIIDFDGFGEPPTPASTASAASAPSAMVTAAPPASGGSSVPVTSSSRSVPSSSPGAGPSTLPDTSGNKTPANVKEEKSPPPGILPSGHLTENTQLLADGDTYDGHSQLPDFIDPLFIPNPPPGARMGDSEEIMTVRPHPMEVPGQQYHMLLHPEGDKLPHGCTIDDLKNLTGGMNGQGKDGRPRLKLNIEKKAPPKMACHFCRNRKIACGIGKGKDKTCNQCERRGLQCSFPTESRRGMRIRRPKNAQTADGSPGQQKDSGRDQNEEDEDTSSENTEGDDPMPISAGGNSTGITSPVDRLSGSPTRQNKKQKLSGKGKGKGTGKMSKGKARVRVAEDASSASGPCFERTMDFDMVDVPPAREGDSTVDVTTNGELRLPDQLNGPPENTFEDRNRFSNNFEIRNSSSSLAGALEMPQDTEMNVAPSNTERRGTPQNNEGLTETELDMPTQFTAEQIAAIAVHGPPPVFPTPIATGGRSTLAFSDWPPSDTLQAPPYEVIDGRRFSLPEVNTQQNTFAHAYEFPRHSLDHQMESHFNPSNGPTSQSRPQHDAHMGRYPTFSMDGRPFVVGAGVHDLPSPSFSAHSTPPSMQVSSASPSLVPSNVGAEVPSVGGPSNTAGVASLPSSLEQNRPPHLSPAFQGGTTKRRSPFTTTPLKMKDTQKRPTEKRK